LPRNRPHTRAGLVEFCGSLPEIIEWRANLAQHPGAAYDQRVNLSGQTFYRRISSTTSGSTADLRCPAEALNLEITECHVMADPADILYMICKQFKALGIAWHRRFLHGISSLTLPPPFFHSPFKSTALLSGMCDDARPGEIGPTILPMANISPGRCRGTEWRHFTVAHAQEAALQLRSGIFYFSKPLSAGWGDRDVIGGRTYVAVVEHIKYAEHSFLPAQVLWLSSYGSSPGK